MMHGVEVRAVHQQAGSSSERSFALPWTGFESGSNTCRGEQIAEYCVSAKIKAWFPGGNRANSNLMREKRRRE
jgi:hypothetical protein